MCGKYDDQNCPDRHPELCKFWQSNDYKRNTKCNFLHVTITNEGDEKQMDTLEFKCVSCKNVWAEKNCVVKHVIKGRETFFCLNNN